MITAFPPFYKPLSLRVCKLLDDIGLSEEIRRMRIDVARTREILHTIVTKYVKSGDFSLYVFGSVAEGTTTEGLKSDVDYVYCTEEWRVVDKIENAPKDKPLTLLMVRDETTKPGYTKLQCVINGIPQTRASSGIAWPEPFMIDSKDRVVFCRPSLPGIVHEVHGPAYSTDASLGYVAHDHVFALRCHIWPDCTKSWQSRSRPYGWPPADTIKKLQSFCVLVVPVGHPYSEEQNKEWRISTSLQERELMHSLNTTQHKCYVLLKLVKKNILEKLVGEESLSSYVLKTCVFYMVENTPADFWKPENLLACLQSCLICLQYWVGNGKCPNYFIPEENMLDRLNDGVISRVRTALEIMISANCKYLLYISSDRFGSMLEVIVSEKEHEHESTRDSSDIRRNGVLDTVATLHVQVNFSRNELLHTVCNGKNNSESIKSLFPLVSDLKRTNVVADHTKEQTAEALNFILPYIELSLMSNIIARDSFVPVGETLKYLTSRKWDEFAFTSDKFSAKLKQATFLHIFGYHQASMDILSKLAALSLDSVTSICPCRGLPIQRLPETVDHSGDDKGRLFQNEFAPCIVFLPTEKEIVSEALRYEMTRSKNMPETSRDKRLQYWFDWAVVDSKILLHFLLYLNHSKFCDNSDIRSDIDNLMKLIKTDDTIVHKETAVNLLGWAFKQEGSLANAKVCFESSLQLHDTHNAATHHLLDLNADDEDDPKTIYTRKDTKL